jgi:hypothetical protein
MNMTLHTWCTVNMHSFIWIVSLSCAGHCKHTEGMGESESVSQYWSHFRLDSGCILYRWRYAVFILMQHAEIPECNCTRTSTILGVSQFWWVRWDCMMVWGIHTWSSTVFMSWNQTVLVVFDVMPCRLVESWISVLKMEAADSCEMLVIFSDTGSYARRH